MLSFGGNTFYAPFTEWQIGRCNLVLFYFLSSMVLTSMMHHGHLQRQASSTYRIVNTAQAEPSLLVAGTNILSPTAVLGDSHDLLVLI